MSFPADRFMMALGVIVLIVFYGLPLWLLMRLILFFIDRMNRSVPSGVFAFCVWTQRFFLCLIAGCLALVFCGSGVLGIADYYASTANRLLAWAMLGLGCYWFSALVLNFPAFPLRWNLLSFWPVQLLVLGVNVVVLIAGDLEFSASIGLMLVCTGVFWYWHLSDRVAITPHEELLGLS